ncbi:monovalent cation/H(+) antiporter subunit G [Endozoicomonas acroporae]|uniref:monovalent cation/H(+) antiporter subunit G n=1 Tax=Endozoicomonas TaxID=305899 RepID=UPI000C75EB08|nr:MULTISPECIES: monovalent cation/H(+) antiporter subunit G [Endozoicomonas]WBA82247.1 monovalent cation/H(+) antiporter subunit G [Endozoicomonas sp. GU-1]WBA85184.1 monovalent cation/H(+) antiporter subunit G [Endozoicomonas sp. GU-1]
MMDWVVASCLIVGVLFSFFSALGILRMPDAYIRMHSSTKAGTIGVGLIMVAVALHFQGVSISSRAVGIIAFILMTAPVAAHLMGKSLLMNNYQMWRGHQQD